MLSGKLAVDANPILSAAIGGKAGQVFLAGSELEFLTVEPVLDEVEKYLPILAAKKGLSLSLTKTALALLPLVVVPTREYAAFIGKAQELIGQRDPDDVPLLALALTYRYPVWTNDSDFQSIPGVEVITTAELLSKLANN
ncbi:PIN domain-containing protein [Ammonifex thiophilus]|uniref:PIN domain nuclease n=1 Tax=Ammonifex thiophilus TaxID=444093 RepID=A0A3D8P118_9THEO|nr:PIN domain-containing protein [Ammonifex thiophilus]RDV80916.1 PIN domain nuclease [Ammonifex thiophilus]